MDTSLTYFSGGIGGFLGILFALNGYGENSKNLEFSKSQRVRNALFLLVGAASILFANWKGLSDKFPDEQRVHMVVVYTVSSLIAIVASVASISVFIAISVVRIARSNRLLKKAPGGR